MANKALYSLRLITSEDYSFLYKLHVATMKGYVQQTWREWDDEYQADRFKENFDPSDGKIIVVGGEDVGAIRLVEGENELFLSVIEIMPEYQGRGIGTAVVSDVIDEANTRGEAVMLRVLKVNPARRLYERLGFEVIEETKTHYLMRRGSDAASALTDEDFLPNIGVGKNNG